MAWHDARIVFAGDAAHATSPSSGRGASIAIEDALVLPKYLRDMSRPEDAFVEYVRLRQESGGADRAVFARVGRTETPGPIARRVRDLVMPVPLKVCECVGAGVDARLPID